MRYKNPPHYFKRWTDWSSITNLSSALASTGSGTLTTVATGNTLSIKNSGPGAGDQDYYSFALAWCMTDLPASTEFSTLFDRYILTAVQCRLICLSNQAPIGIAGFSVNTTGGNAVIHQVTDYDDNSAFPASATGLGQMRQYESYSVKNLIVLKPIKRMIHPHIALAAYGGSVFTSYANVKDQWVDFNSPSVPHYGWKFMIEVRNESSGAYTQDYKVEFAYLFTCKDLR
jgi:hypothetical protein